MLTALTVFAFYLLIGAATMLAFWAIQVRFGDASDLDPDNLLVKVLSKRRVELKSFDLVVTADDDTIAPSSEAMSGEVQSPRSMNASAILGNLNSVIISPEIWLDDQCFELKTSIGNTEFYNLQTLPRYTDLQERQQIKQELVSEVLAELRREVSLTQEENYRRILSLMTELAVESRRGAHGPSTTENLDPQVHGPKSSFHDSLETVH